MDHGSRYHTSKAPGPGQPPSTPWPEWLRDPCHGCADDVALPRATPPSCTKLHQAAPSCTKVAPKLHQPSSGLDRPRSPSLFDHSHPSQGDPIRQRTLDTHAAHSPDPTSPQLSQAKPCCPSKPIGSAATLLSRRGTSVLAMMGSCPGAACALFSIIGDTILPFFLVSHGLAVVWAH